MMTLAGVVVYNEGMNVITLISSREAADDLGITRQAVNVLVHIGRLPAYRIGNRLYFDRADLAAYVAGKKKAGRPAKGAVTS